MTCTASNKSNSSSIPQGVVDSYYTLPWVMWEAITGVEGIPCWELLWHTLANGALVYSSQGGRYHAEAAWQWGRDSTVLTIPLRNHAIPHCMYAFHLRCAPWRVTLCFSPFCRRGPFYGDSGKNKWIGRPVALVTIGTLLWNMEGSPLPETLTERWISQGMVCRRFIYGSLSLSVGVPLGNLGRGSIYREMWEIVGGGSRNGAPLFTGALLGEPGGIKQGSRDGHIFPWRPHRETWEGSYAGGLCVEEGFRMGVSPYRGPIGEPGGGGPSTGNFEK
jgi:hypothetical protein